MSGRDPIGTERQSGSIGGPDRALIAVVPGGELDGRGIVVVMGIGGHDEELARLGGTLVGNGRVQREREALAVG
jgi:hypothetical protein